MNPDERVLQIEKEIRSQARGKSVFIVNLAMSQLRLVVQQTGAGDTQIAPGLNVREALDKIRDILVLAYFPVQYDADVALVKEAYDSLKKEG